MEAFAWKGGGVRRLEEYNDSVKKTSVPQHRGGMMLFYSVRCRFIRKHGREAFAIREDIDMMMRDS